MRDERRPVLVGAAQLLRREVDPVRAPEPVAMLEEVARRAADDAGVGERALRELDTVGVVQVLGWRPRNGPRLLAERLGARPAREYETATGGEMPLALLSRVATEIAEGTACIGLIAGCNDIRTRRRARRDRVVLVRDTGGAGEPTLIGTHRLGSSEREAEYGLRLPSEIYPLFENALRARRGLDLETHRARMGALMSRLSEVAAKNPYAWFPVARSADEITVPSPHNRMVAFPYTKYMNAVLETDQAAAVLVMSAAAARSLGIPEPRWVHWWGGACAEEEAWYPSERSDFAACPAMGDAVAGALAGAGLTLDGIDRFDFYSAFPVALEMACEMLGLDEDDPRGLTVTGGLPYAGGPGNAYTLHSLAAMMEVLRAEPGAKGLLTGAGWYLTKHAACVCSAEPRPETAPAPREAAPRGARPGPLPPVEDAEGRGTVEAYTVIFDRDGAPARAVVLGRTEDGRRFLANAPDERALLEGFVAEEGVGRVGALSSRDGSTVFDPR